ncbi:nitrite reductase [Anaerobacillus alkalidiazotrophicus]|uniref:nitrite reductase (cytochrome; ammonia-forming) n=1 Tax=Anaerobacillus alkalidiazotrophicus TaxID=472963 RepID=A0A1S2MC96_9BACI|nr:ammonia-forming cytochrome c nitrite reductase subunit c552 [Anaerobacillus alkalidiazotrophicus]OIJ21437.1 nitrite reductase [Anaerobacillus alkalidiazotrophicus]
MRKFGLVFKLLMIVLTLIILQACLGPDDLTVDETEPLTDLSPNEYLNTAFKDAFPVHYESFLRNMGIGRPPVSKFIPEYEPYLPILFAGFPFEQEYNTTRGHTYAVEDVISIARIGERSIGSCMTCKSSTVTPLLQEFGDDYWAANFRGEILPRMEELASVGASEELGEYGHVSIGCSDCHNPVTMELRITRPSLTNALARQGIDVTEATRNEMRTYVCAQCHVEYYFEPELQKVRFPWDLGNRPEDMYDYFQTIAIEEGFNYDYIHAVSGSPILKAQHPEYELWSYGSHGRAGVSCSDCHMPFERRDDRRKISSHYWVSPLETIQQSCRTCHSDKTEKYIRDRVGEIQERHLNAVHEAQDLTVEAHYYVNRMITAGAPEDRISEAQNFVREAQWYTDIIAAENSDGFHNPQGGMDTLRMASDAANNVLKLATEELLKLNVDLDELRTEISKVKETVLNEEDPFQKHIHATNEFFPKQN